VRFEVKLGTTRLEKANVDKWLKECQLSLHQDGRYNGRLMAILERKFPAGTPADELRTRLDAGAEPTLTRDRFTVAKAAVIKRWAGANHLPLAELTGTGRARGKRAAVVASLACGVSTRDQPHRHRRVQLLKLARSPGP
jgi:hypothetical protein